MANKINTNGRTRSLLIVVHDDKKVGKNQMHAERMEHARALFVQELKSLKINEVDAVMKRWGVELFPQDIGDFYSSIAYANDYPKKKRLHETKLREHNGII